jgi:hypothetical protein
VRVQVREWNGHDADADAEAEPFSFGIASLAVGAQAAREHDMGSKWPRSIRQNSNASTVPAGPLSAYNSRSVLSAHGASSFMIFLLDHYKSRLL